MNNNSIDNSEVETSEVPVNGATAPDSHTGTAHTDAEHTEAVDSGASAYITALQAELEEARAKTEEAQNKLLYATADFQNTLRRKEEQYRSDQKFANSELIKSLLPVLDNFERALKAAEKTQSVEALVGGVTGTLKQLQSALQKAGVTTIEALGKEFDPNFHEAIEHMETSEYPSNTVAEVVQNGYTLHERVLRPSLVKVVS